MQNHINHIQALQRKGWTQSEISAAAGIHRVTLARAMRPGAVVKSNTVAALLSVHTAQLRDMRAERLKTKEKQK